MQLPNIFLLAVAAAATLTSASPVPEQPQLEKRACQTQMPRSLGFPNNYDVTRTSAGASTTNNIAFNIAPGAVGPCSLVYQFPVGFPLRTSGSNGGNPPIEVRAGGSLVGTAALVADGAVHTINSFACAPNLEYQLGIADWATGEVAFQVTQAGTGFYMTYSC
ncbi:hypothetical protein NKR23_g1509 [Pleurostoma richardsiae]|uniref:Ubiquitin 3 binding protein But2 C-terminal domain-containing protein n=1 Tax=Pleurostoma richardsiae TaxID=41990 RepID=A0AA38RS64_9PEZI|nr:hypothetical protein NKR23_g1509 [Pleurostoma richardsiae]